MKLQLFARLRKFPAAAAFCTMAMGGAALWSRQSLAHTDALGFLISNGSATGLYHVQIFYGSWHSSGISAAEGALDLSNSSGNLIGTQPFSLALGPVSAGTVPAGLIPGTNYFFPDTSTPQQGDLTGNPANHPIYYFQSTTFLDLTPGSYTFGYNAGSAFTVFWQPSDSAINNGSFVIASDGGLGGVGGTTPVATNIDVTAPSYASSNLGTTVNPAFQGGVLLIDEAAATYAQNFTVDNSGSNRIDLAGNHTTFTGTFTDATPGVPGGIIFNDSGSGGSATLTGVNTQTGGTTLNAGTLMIGGTGTLGASSGSTTVAGGTLDLGGTTQTQAVLNQSGGTVQAGALQVTSYQLSGGTLAGTAAVTASTLLDMQAGSVNGVLAGSAALTKTGAGTVTLAAANTYSGGTNITAGTLALSGTGRLGASSGSTSVAGGTLDLGGTTQTQSAFNQSGGTVQAGALQVTGYQLIGGTLAGTAVVTASTLLDMQTGSVNGVLAGAAPLTKTGAGTVTLAAANSYSGGTNITAGTLALSGTGRLGATSGSTSVAGGTLDLGGTTQTQSAFNQSGGTVQAGALHVASYQLTGGTLGSTTAVTASTLLDLQSGTANGTLTGTASLAKSGAGTVTVAAANGYSGGTILRAGTLALSGAGTLGAGSGTTTINAGTLDLGGTTQTQGAFNHSGGTVQAGALHVTSYQLNGGTLAGNALVTATTLLDMQAGSVNGALTGTAALTKTGAGTVTLAGTNTFTGDTTIAAGVLALAGTGSLATSSSLLNNGRFDISATTLGASLVDLSGVGNTELGARRLTLTGASGSYGGVITGTGGLTLASGFKALTGMSTYTGATMVSAGELRVNNTLGDTAVTVQAGGTLSGIGEIDGSVLVQSGGKLSPGQSPGTLTVGSLTLNSGSTSVFQLGAAGIVAGPLNDLVDVAGALALGGTLDATAASVGQYRLFNAESVTGAFDVVDLSAPTVPGATWLVYSNNSGGGSAVEVNLGVFGAGQALQFWDGTDTLGNNTVNGGNGTWNSTFTNWTGPPGQAGVNAASGNSIAVFQGSPGTVVVQGAQAFDTLDFNTDGYVLAPGVNGALVLNHEGVINVTAGVATLAVPIGTGSQATLTKQGAGDLVLTSTNTWSGGTRIVGGTLQIGAGGNTGSLLGAVANDGTLSFDRSDAVTFKGAISGSGAVTQRGTGSTTLAASNSYAGGTTISSGTLIGTAGSFGSGAILNNAALIIDQPADATLDDPIAGVGSFTKRGAGALTLDGSSSLTGPTTVAAGRLAIQGSLGSSVVTVNSGASLSGVGTVGGLIVHSGAALATGNNGISTGKVTSFITQEAGSIWRLQINSSGTSDHLSAAGPATIASGALLNLSKLDAGRYVLGAHYVVLDAAGGVTGAYTLTGDTRVSAFFDVVGHYDATHAYLDVAQTRSFTAAGTTVNQRGAARGIDGLGVGNALYTAMGYLQSDAEVSAALDQLSGELHASAQAAAVEDSRFVREAALHRVRASFDAVAAADGARNEQSAADRPVVWGDTFGSWGRTVSDSNAAAFNRSVRGLFVGTDGQPAENLRAGLLGGYSRADFHATARGSAGTSDNYHVGLYGGGEWGALGLRLGAAYSLQRLQTRRSVAFAGYADQLLADYRAHTTQLFGELGYRIATVRMAYEPFVSLAQVDLRTAGFSEKGGAAALTVKSQGLNVPFSTLGMRFSTPLSTRPAATLTLRAMLGWRHALGDTVSASTMAFAGGNSFEVVGLPVARDLTVLELGVAGKLARGMSLGIAYSGQAGDGLTDHGVKAQFNWQFH